MYNLGRMLAQEDPQEAKHWLQQATEQGDAEVKEAAKEMLAHLRSVTLSS
jgi:FimV-like protein